MCRVNQFVYYRCTVATHSRSRLFNAQISVKNFIFELRAHETDDQLFDSLLFVCWLGFSSFCLFHFKAQFFIKNQKCVAKLSNFDNLVVEGFLIQCWKNHSAQKASCTVVYDSGGVKFAFVGRHPVPSDDEGQRRGATLVELQQQPNRGKIKPKPPPPSPSPPFPHSMLILHYTAVLGFIQRIKSMILWYRAWCVRLLLAKFNPKRRKHWWYS